MSNLLRGGMDKYHKLSSRSKTLLWAYFALHVVTLIAIAILTPAYLFSRTHLAQYILRDSDLNLNN